MSHRIAPPESLPEFYVEACYLLDFHLAWSLQNSGETLEYHRSEIDLDLLMEWSRHRHRLEPYTRAVFDMKRAAPIVTACLEFMDALVKDWMRKLSGGEPLQPLDDARLDALREHERRLDSVPGDKWEVKY